MAALRKRGKNDDRRAGKCTHPKTIFTRCRIPQRLQSPNTCTFPRNLRPSRRAFVYNFVINDRAIERNPGTTNRNTFNVPRGRRADGNTKWWSGSARDGSVNLSVNRPPEFHVRVWKRTFSFGHATFRVAPPNVTRRARYSTTIRDAVVRFFLSTRRIVSEVFGLAVPRHGSYATIVLVERAFPKLNDRFFEKTLSLASRDIRTHARMSRVYDVLRYRVTGRGRNVVVGLGTRRRIREIQVVHYVRT